MIKQTLWQNIADTLKQEISRGDLAKGSKLPTEAELAKRFGVNRHTVRKSIANLAEQGLIWSKRGSGVFVAQMPTIYKMSNRVRFSQNLLDAGRTPSRQTLLMSIRPATQEEANGLQIEHKSPVHHYEGISFSDTVPIALFTSVFCATRFAELDMHIRALGSVTAALKQCGVTDYTRASTQIGAFAADRVQANHLRIKQGDPLLCTTSINIDPDNCPVEFGRTYFSGKHVTLNFNS